MVRAVKDIMNRCAGHSTTEFMLMVVMVTLMAVAFREAFWPAIRVGVNPILSHVASDGRIPN